MMPLVYPPHVFALAMATGSGVPLGVLGPVVAIPIWPAVAALLLLAIATWVGVHRATRKLRQEHEGAQRFARAVQNELVDVERRREELFKSIEGILGERDEWQRLYRQQASAHGVAQEMLMAERARLVRQVISVKKKPSTSSMIDRVVEAFGREHGEAAVEQRVETCQAKRPEGSSGGMLVEASDGASEQEP